MKNQILFLVFIIIFQFSIEPLIAQESEAEIQIREVLVNQETAWNRGDFKGYMSGYWNDDSLKFIGKSGIQYGWQNTLENYKKSYPDKESMGNLKFEIINVDILEEASAFVIGKWKLTRDIGNLEGYFTLLFKWIDHKWVIVCDHSS